MRNLRRTSCRTLPAACADARIDRDMVTVGRDCAGRAKIKTTATADDVGARMRAEVGREVHIERLVELTDEIARLQHGAQDGGSVGGIGTQIAVAQIPSGKQRRAAGQIEQDVALHRNTVARRFEHEAIARGWIRCGITVDDHVECAQITLCTAQPAAKQNEFGAPWRQNVVCVLKQQGHGEMILEKFGGFDRARITAIDQGCPLADDPDGRRLRLGHGGSGEQRRNLGRGGMGILRPAGRLANIDKTRFGKAGLLCGNGLEQRRLLGTGDQNRFTAVQCGAHAVKLRAA